MRRRAFIAALAASAVPRARAAARAAFPERPIRIVMPFAAGGGPDVLARAQAREMARVLGVDVIVDNRPGAGGALAARITASAPADGYTLTLGTSTHVVNLYLLREPGYDPVADFSAVASCWTSPSVLVVRATGPLRTYAGLVARLRAAPGELNYASGGVGTLAHLAGATFVRVLGVDAAHVPYRGSVDIVPALLKGEVQFAFPIASTALPALSRDGIRALAVTGARRLARLPDVPTLRELVGDERLVQEAWGGWWAPRDTPADVVGRLFAANAASLDAPAVVRLFADSGSDARASASSADFAAFVRDEVRRWAGIAALLDLPKA